MEYRKFGTKFVVRLEKGEEVVESIKTLCRENNIRLGTVSGIGAADKATIGLFETATKKYHSQELTGGYGNHQLNWQHLYKRGGAFTYICTLP